MSSTTSTVAADSPELLQRWLTTAIESSPSGVLITDAAGRIVLANRAVERIFGYERKALIGQPVEMLIPVHLRGRHAADRAAFVPTLRERPMGRGREFAALRRDGSEVFVEIGLTPLPTDAGLFTVSSIVDIGAEVRAESERQALEGQLRHAQKLEAVGRLAGGIAHDFNNILTAIIAFGELAMDALPAGTTVREDLEQIAMAASRGKALTRQMLAFSRYQEVELRPLDLNDVITGMEGLLRRLLGADVRLDARLTSRVAHVYADPNQIEQILLNLAVNARDAMPAGGVLTIETRNVYVDEQYATAHPGTSAGPHVQLVVTDTGTGMDADIQTRIFEPFFTTKPSGVGTGLGLSTVHGIVRQSGGSIWVYSEVGRGTTFKVYFPEYVGEADVQPSVLVLDWSAPGNGRILLVEDDAAVRAGIRRVLTRGGFEVAEATNGTEALGALEGPGGSFDLLITDLIMPDVGGVELARRVAARWPAVRLLFMSGYSSTAIQGRGTLAPEVRYLEKPFTPLELLAKVQEILQHPSTGEQNRLGA